MKLFLDVPKIKKAKMFLCNLDFFIFYRFLILNTNTKHDELHYG